MSKSYELNEGELGSLSEGIVTVENILHKADRKYMAKKNIFKKIIIMNKIY